MENNEAQPQTFVEMVLALLEDRFPWLGTDEPASGAETVDQLSDLHETLQESRAADQSKKATKR
jgi:hypothetical protein